MAHTAPTVDEFIEQYPEFEGQEEKVERTLTWALRRVDTSWTEGDYPIAIMLLTAHLLTSAETALAGGAIASESLGAISISYAKSASMDALGGTEYGAQYLELLRMNFPSSILVV